MLKITIELIPHGIKEKAKIISEMTIGNTGKTHIQSIYSYRYKGWVASMKDEKRKEFSGEVEHNRNFPLFSLLHQIFRQFYINDFQ